ncbi:MAG: DNA polymerase III subunit beta, partial [Planctomycetaceae bacterium]|nr:DNA polymerase III subunit beta [Planctomycetaceae bacterium]
MKITSNRKQFSDSFQIAAAVAAARDVRPILQNVKLTAKKDEVLLQATDTEVGIRVALDFCEVNKAGETILVTKDFRQILQMSISEEISIENVKEKVTISGVGGDESWTYMVQPADEFPDVEEFKGEAYHEISASVLSQLIRRTAYATDPDSHRYALGGVLIEFTDDTITAVATDGRRMSVQDGGAEKFGDHKVETAILPRRAFELIGKMLDKDEETVKITVTENLAQFQYKNKTFFTRQLE